MAQIRTELTAGSKATDWSILDMGKNLNAL